MPISLFSPKIILFWFVVVSIFFSWSSVQAASDVSDNDPHYETYQRVLEHGLFTRFSDNTFRPGLTVTRAEALAVAMRTAGIYPDSQYGGESFFRDVDPNEWFAPLIATAVQRRIVINKHEYFFPYQLVTRAEALAFLTRAVKVDFAPYFARTRGIAEDVTAEAWFAPHFAYAKQFQIIPLLADNFYRPLGIVTRGELAIMADKQQQLLWGDRQTVKLIELQGQLQRFLLLIKSGKNKEAEFHLHRIVTLNDQLIRLRNDHNAHASKFISRALRHFTDGLRFLQKNAKLAALESLLLAHKQVQNVLDSDSDLLEFAKELDQIINNVIITPLTSANAG